MIHALHGFLQPWLISVLFIVWRRKLAILCLALFGTAAGYMTHMLWPKSYRATALVLIEAQKVPDKFVQSTVSTEVTDRISSISQEILSNTRLQKIVDDFKLFQEEKKTKYPEEILELMRKSISIRLEKGMSRDRTGAFYVEFTGKQPTVVAEVTNRIVSLFLEQNLRERALSAEGTSEFLDGQLSEARRNLEEQEKRLADYKLRHEGSLPGQEQYISSVIARLQQELQFVEESIARANLNKITLENAMQASRSTDMLTSQLVERSEVKSAEAPKPKTRSQLLEQQLELVLMKYKATHPDVLELKRQIDVERKSEVEPVQKVVASTEPSPQILRWRLQAKERDDNYRNQMTVIEKELENRSRQRAEILSRIEQQQTQLGQLPVRELQMGAITRDYEISVLTYKALLDKGQTAHISSEMERRQKGERFKVVDPAKTPEKPLGLNAEASAALGAGVCLLLSILTLQGIAMKQNALLGEWEIPGDIPVLARIPVNEAMAPKEKSSRRPLFPRRYKVRFTQSSN